VINDLDPDLADGLAESQLAWFGKKITAALDGWPCRVARIDHDELSAGSNCSIVRHRKSLVLD
jgi:hypothetical protein